jgi:hypothetical protein
MEIIETLLKVAKQLFGLKSELMLAKKERKATIATYLENVAITITEVAIELRLGNVPHGKCAEMGGHTELLQETIGDLIDKKKLEDLTSYLKTAVEVESIAIELDKAKDSEKEIAKLDEAAGWFRALAASINASP